MDESDAGTGSASESGLGRSEQAIDQHREYHAGEGHVTIIALFSKAEYGKSDSRDRRGDEQQETELDNPAATEPDHTVQYAGYRAQGGWLSAKDMELRLFKSMPHQINAAAA